MGGGARSPARRVREGEAWRIRAAEERDLPAIHTLEVASFADPWPLTGFRELLDRSHVTFEVVETAAGALLAYFIVLRAADEAEVANLAVQPHARRAGIGRAVLERLLARAAQEGVRAVYLEVRESNVAAQALYAAHGFVQAGRRRGYYRKPDEDALVLRRVL